MKVNRKKFIDEARAKRMTYDEIGRLLGISRQRVHQIHIGYKSPYHRIYKPTESQRKNIVNLENIKLNAPNLNGNITAITGIKAGSRDRIRELVRIRDNHTCQICLKVWEKGQRRFDVHHLDEEFEGKSDLKKLSVTELDRPNLSRMITLCHKCHLNLDGVRRKMSIAGRKAQEKQGQKVVEVSHNIGDKVGL